MESNSNLANGESNDHPLNWLINELYKVDWNPFVEHRRYITMEGHLEMFNDQETDPEQKWKRLYFRAKDGRWAWYASHCADEHPISDILLTGAEVRSNKEDWTVTVKGGKENADLRVRVPSNVFEKWHQTLLNHSSSALVDSYIQPNWPPDPHRTNRVLLLELGSQSIRAGILTQKPSLPHIFIPSSSSGNEAESGNNGPPIQVTEDGMRLETPALLELLQKVKDKAAVQAKSMDIRFRAQDFEVLLTIPQRFDIVSAKKALRMLLDKALGFKSISIVRQPSLILYSYDVTTGVVVELGEQFCIVPVIDEFVVEEAVQPLPYGASQIREQLHKRVDLQPALKLAGQGADAEQLLLRILVEKTCYINSNSSDPERAKDAVVKLQLGGQQLSIAVDAETRFSAPEGLFTPSLWGLEAAGLHQLVHEAIQRCPIDSRRPLYRAVYLAGGTSLLRGLAHRLERELAQLVPQSIPVQVLNSPWRRHSAYLGAHLIATADDFPKCCVGEAGLDDYLRRMSTAADT